MGFTPSATKQEAVDRLHRLIGLPQEPLGPGSKERRRTFAHIAEALGLTVSSNSTKPDLACAACEELGGDWDTSCYSAGDTITLVGINRLLGLLEGRMATAKTTTKNMGTSKMADDETAMEDDDRAALEGGLAEQISLLSDVTDTPTEFEPTRITIDPTDIDFATPSWMAALAAVQGWLRLPDLLVLDDPTNFVSALARGLGFDDTGPAIEHGAGSTRLSLLGLDRLRERVDRALQLQQTFVEDLEAEGGTAAGATGRWVEAWDDEPEIEESAGPVSAKALTWPINEFSGRATRGKLNLSPSYQRGDVWPTTDSQMLIESILRGIPLPSVIILKPHRQAGGAPYEVVDGKQRLTAILRFMGKHPRALEIVKAEAAKHDGADLEGLFQKDYPAFRKAWKNLAGEQLTATKEREHFFPFKLRRDAPALTGDLAFLAGKYYTEIRNVPVYIADDRVEVGEIFEQVTEYKIPVIEYSKATTRQIHEVFNLYNKQGKHLNAEEIRNALYHGVDLMRGLIVVAGDNEDIDSVAPFLKTVWTDVGRIQGLLDDYAFGAARYRRTKVLSWLSSLLLVDSMEGGRPKRLSTARQVDALLQRVEGDANDPLRDPQKIRDAFTLIFRGMDAHSAVDEAWAPVFKDNSKGLKWQELQLVASLLGVTISAAVLGDRTEVTLAEAAGELAEKTATKVWWRPEKTQTGKQWEYIADVSMRIVRILGVDPEEASETLVARFGFTCIPTLLAVSSDGRAG